MAKKSISRRIYKKGVSSQILSGFLKLIGGTMSGTIEMSGNRVNNPLLTWVDGIVKISRSAIHPLLKLDFSYITSNRTIVFQDKDHTIAGLDDIKNIAVVLTTTPLSHTGSTTETIKYTEQIPANTFTTHDKITKEILASAIGLGGNKTIKCYVNTTPNLSGTPVLISTYSTNNLGYSLISSFFVDSNSSMKAYKPGTSNLSTYWGSSNASLGTFAINWGVSQYLVVTVQLAVNTDIIQLESIYLKRDRK